MADGTWLPAWHASRADVMEHSCQPGTHAGRPRVRALFGLSQGNYVELFSTSCKAASVLAQLCNPGICHGASTTYHAELAKWFCRLPYHVSIHIPPNTAPSDFHTSRQAGRQAFSSSSSIFQEGWC